MRTLIGVIFFLFWFVVSFTFADDYGLPFEGSIIESKTNANIELPISAVFFKEADHKNTASGFYAEKTIQINGRFTYHVLDFPIGKSSSEVYQQFLSKAQRFGYEILFQCKQYDCGKKDGYRAYLSNRLDDKNNTQNYLVVRKGRVFKSIYVADIDGQSRGFFLDAYEINDHFDSALNLIQFSSGQSDLSEPAKEKIDRWIATMIKGESQVISVFGNADSSGGLAANIQLAQDRANVVKSYIIKRHHLSEEQLVNLSAANLARPLTSERGRYVELTVHSAR